ncbi:MAG: PKD domain-containing protein, partial [Kiritimatiellae bacterium]|nr:PKD domain-containing protein [Kiritimatiellia bacterium]
YAGGGVSFVALFDCVISNNYAGSLGGGVDKSPLFRCKVLYNTAGSEGGGVHFSEWDVNIVQDSIIIGNRANFGGGVSETIVSNCFLFGNEAEHGAAAFGGTLNHCTVVGNTAEWYAGGVEYGAVMNSIIYYNEAPQYPNSYDGSFEYCCMPGSSGTGNIQADPQLIGGMHILSTSPCVGAANSADTLGLDIDDQAWSTPPSMGCDEPLSPYEGKLNPEIYGGQSSLQVGEPLDLAGIIEGETASCIWDYDDGSSVTNLTFVTHAWDTEGEYTVSLTAYNETYPEGVGVSFDVSVSDQSVCYVWTNSPSPAVPYDTWDTAAHTIQDALDVAEDAYLVLVTNGVYDQGGCVGPEMSLTNRICATNAVTIQSVNGSEMTIICGEGTLGASAVRCAYLDGGAVLSGFTLTNGCTLSGETDADADKAGGGALALDGRLEQCVLSGNAAYQLGGGLCGGSGYDCVISGNTADSGGGVSGSCLTNCVIRENSAYTGGGAVNAQLCDCLVIDNEADLLGGGIQGGLNYSCTVYGNTAQSAGGGVYQGQYANCIIWGNSAEIDGDVYQATINYCCVGNNPGGEGNLEEDPLFMDAVGGDFNLTLASPCINVGDNGYVVTDTDLNGDRRLQGGVVDMGVVEYPCYTIASLTYGKGTIGDDEVIYGKKGEDVSIPITPDLYYHIGLVLTNGTEAPCTNLLAWNDVQADGVIAVTFAADLAVQETPYWWLAQYGWTNEFDAAALADQDGDGMLTWKEYVAGTDPTEATSVLLGEVQSSSTDEADPVICWMGSDQPGRAYSILWNNALSGTEWSVLVEDVLSAYPAINSYTDAQHTAEQVNYYRIQVKPVE